MFDYDCGEIRLVSVVLADVIFDPRDCRRCERFEEENTAVVFYDKVRLDLAQMSGRISRSYKRITAKTSCLHVEKMPSKVMGKD